MDARERVEAYAEKREHHPHANNRNDVYAPRAFAALRVVLRVADAWEDVATVTPVRVGISFEEAARQIREAIAREMGGGDDG